VQVLSKNYQWRYFSFETALACTRKDVEPYQQVPENVKQIILGVLVKNLEATEKKRKAHQYSVNDDDDEIKEISSKDINNPKSIAKKRILEKKTCR
jgi:hypothetical protein